jgi:hypothetical protein
LSIRHWWMESNKPNPVNAVLGNQNLQ